MENSEWSEDEWYAKAARYCAAAEHCSSEVREKLRQWGYEGDCAPVIERLRGDGYIDEARYCKAYVHDKAAFQGWGRRKIRMMLRSKGLPEDETEAALQGLDPEIYKGVLEHLVERKKGYDRDKLLRFLLQRGFDYADIKNALEDYFTEDAAD